MILGRELRAETDVAAEIAGMAVVRQDLIEVGRQLKGAVFGPFQQPE